MSEIEKRRLSERIRRKSAAYRVTFLAADGKPSHYGAQVLADLNRYCGVERGGLVISKVSGMTDPLATAYRAGQRDVFLRIQQFLRLQSADIPEDKFDERTT